MRRLRVLDTTRRRATCATLLSACRLSRDRRVACRAGCALERFALEVCRSHSDRLRRERLEHSAVSESPAEPPLVGAEWWMQVRRVAETDASGGGACHTPIRLHWDCDEGRLGWREHVPPLLATVTYLCDVGAPTLLLPLSADAGGAMGASIAEPTGALSGAAEPAPGRLAHAVLSYPRQGKHLAFDGRMLHGAPAELSAPPPRVDVAPGGERLRVSILVNLWPHRPLSRGALPQALAATLAAREHPSGGAQPWALPSLLSIGPTVAPALPTACAAAEVGPDGDGAAARTIGLDVGGSGEHNRYAVRSLRWHLLASARRGEAGVDLLRVPASLEARAICLA